MSEEMVGATFGLMMFGYGYGGGPALFTGLGLGYFAGYGRKISRLKTVATAIVATTVFVVVLMIYLKQLELGILFFLLPCAIAAALMGRWFIVKLGLIDYEPPYDP
jgi:uncharacterized membrane protein YfcA